MDISIGGSDEASDFCSLVCEKIRKECKKELKNKANEYNTPGYINIALLLKSLISKENEFHFTYGEWGEIWQSLEDKFKNNQYNDCEELSEWVIKMNGISKEQQ